VLALEFKQYKSNINMYYFVDENIRELIITIIYINDICFIGSRYFLLFLELKQNSWWNRNVMILEKPKSFLGCI